jgi:uncharacterized protein (DUF58 family)
MPTRTGWTVIALGALAIAGGRLLGSVQLYVVGAAAAALLFAAGLQLVGRLGMLRRQQVQCSRTIRPWRVHAGQPAVVHLSAVNTGNRRSPTMQLRDQVGARHRTRVQVPSLSPGQEVEGSYQLPTATRGVLPIGPLRALVSDASGLLATTHHIADTESLLVYPRVDRIPPARRSHTGTSTGGRGQATWPGGDDFHALRPYQAGDDLRLVHWPTAARSDELVVRRNEELRQHHTVVVLDTNDDMHTAGSFELCVSAAASVLAAGAARGDLLTLLTTDDRPNPIESSTSADAAFDVLATMVTAPDSGDTDTRRWQRFTAGCTVVIVTTTMGAAALTAPLLATAGGLRRPGLSVLVQFDPSSWGDSSTTAPAVLPPTIAGPGTIAALTVTDQQPFTTCWSSWATASPALTGSR